MNNQPLRIWNRNCNSTVQMTSNWYWKLKIVQQTKLASDNRRTTKTATKKRKCFNINVTQTVENVNTTSMWCSRFITCEKPMENVKKSLVPPWVTFQSLKITKMAVWESVEEEGAAGLPHADLISWSYHSCHSELWNCHYELQNYKNATLGLKCWPIDFATWKWHGNDVEMMWWLSSTKYWRPSSKVASPKYLKIIKNTN